jgi:cyanophycinase
VFTTPDHDTPYAYFLRTPGPPEVCVAGTPLTYRNIEVYRIGPGGRFDLDTWRGAAGISYTLSAEAGVLTSSRGAIY